MIVTVLASLLAAAPAPPPPAPPAVIRVVGHGSVSVAPDVATIAWTLRGEGRTSDEALRAMVAVRDATDRVLVGKASVRTGRLSIEEARDKACDDDDVGATRLSTGACAITGYVATMTATARVTPVTEAGTLLGLLGRAGAVGPRLADFDLRDPAAAERAAVAAAIADARRQAEAIAVASHVRLGALQRVEDQRAGPTLGEDVVVTAMAAPALVSPPPIAVAIAPEPIETEATLIVEFAVGGAG